ncbi:hypothetical protein Nepgr_014897 [Nepenthes gracilis]|uniref:Chromatin assembly factor 1 subunit FAS1 n=1 Tax=Nepenthes gracilis TaxID=150966 RepID=A0AAD3SM18_NEPGR|nr:hypothetical protein Nepgr_014897 [Nepenthes gracilis]
MVDVTMINPESPDESAKKLLRRKRRSQIYEMLAPEERERKIKDLNEELQSLVEYFKEVLCENVVLDSHLSSLSSSNVNAMIAVLLEEKRASYSKLVSEIYGRLKEREIVVTIASVKGSVLDVGKRILYGVPNAEADVLEDETDSCLWCWETRDMKFLPNSIRGAVKIRRICRKKISERITAILAVITALQNPENDQSYKLDLMRASYKLNKVLNEADIRLLVENMAQKNGSDMAEKEAMREEKILMKQQEKTKRQIEKERKKADRELQKEKLQSEKELKRLQGEDDKRRKREESEMRRQLKRKQEDAERDQRRREKEEAGLKKQLSIQKQASIMERFIKRSKCNLTYDIDQSVTSASDASPNNSERLPELITFSMDSALSQKEEVDVDEIRKCHFNSWRSLGHSIRLVNKQHWGIRRKPKTELFKELKLSTNKGLACDENSTIESLVDGWDDEITDDKSSHANVSGCSSSDKKGRRSKQLLQFDKSYRPAFYGIWPKKSHIVGPRHPLKKDPDLDYDVDSDEEWEEEAPGESLSDCDKDEEESLDEECLKADEESESNDGFFVPDGYLSENEGVETDRNHRSVMDEDARTSSSYKPEAVCEEYSSWIQQQKYLHNLTEHALRKNQPLIIANLMHDKASFLPIGNLKGALALEQMCLQAIAMRAFPGASPVEVPSYDILPEEDQEAQIPNSKGNMIPPGISATILDSDMPKIVSAIRSCPHGLNKVLESLQLKFPSIPKGHLRNKVREIADFVDNRWQVKKEILDKLGISVSPEKTGGRTESIAKFFPKRCLPPAGHSAAHHETVPESSLKPGSATQQELGCLYNM